MATKSERARRKAKKKKEQARRRSHRTTSERKRDDQARRRSANAAQARRQEVRQEQELREEQERLEAAQAVASGNVSATSGTSTPEGAETALSGDSGETLPGETSPEQVGTDAQQEQAKYEAANRAYVSEARQYAGEGVRSGELYAGSGLGTLEQSVEAQAEHNEAKYQQEQATYEAANRAYVSESRQHAGEGVRSGELYAGSGLGTLEQSVEAQAEHNEAKYQQEQATYEAANRAYVSESRQHAGEGVRSGELYAGSGLGTLEQSVEAQAEHNEAKYQQEQATYSRLTAEGRAARAARIDQLIDQGLSEELTPAGQQRLGEDVDVEQRRGLSPAQMQTYLRQQNAAELEAARNADIEQRRGLSPAQMQTYLRQQNAADAESRYEYDRPDYQDPRLRTPEEQEAVETFGDVTDAAGLLSSPSTPAPTAGETDTPYDKVEGLRRFYAESAGAEEAADPLSDIGGPERESAQQRVFRHALEEGYGDSLSEYRSRAHTLGQVYDDAVQSGRADDEMLSMTGGAELRAPDATRQRYDQHGRLVSFQAEPYVHPRDLDERQLLNEPVDIRKSKAQFIEDSLGTEREFVNRRAGLSVPGQLGAADQGFDEIATNPALASIAARRGADVAADIAVPYYDAITGADERSVAGTVGLATFDTATLIPVVGQYARATRVARAGAQGAAFRRAANLTLNPFAGVREGTSYMMRPYGGAAEVAEEGIPLLDLPPAQAAVHVPGRDPLRRADELLTATVREVTYPAELVARGAVPEGAITNVDVTARIPTWRFGSDAEAVALRNELNRQAQAGVVNPSVETSLGERITVQSPTIQREMQGITTHATPDVRPFSEGVTIRSSPSEPDTGLFDSSNPPSQLTQQSAFGHGSLGPGERYHGGYVSTLHGEPNAGRMFSPGQQVPSVDDHAKIFESRHMGPVVEVERLTPEGTRIEGPTVSYQVRPAGSEQFGRGVILNPDVPASRQITRGEATRLQLRGLQGLVTNTGDVVQYERLTPDEVRYIEQSRGTTGFAEEGIADAVRREDAARRAAELADPSTRAPAVARTGAILTRATAQAFYDPAEAEATDPRLAAARPDQPTSIDRQAQPADPSEYTDPRLEPRRDPAADSLISSTLGREDTPADPGEFVHRSFRDATREDDDLAYDLSRNGLGAAPTEPDRG